MRVPVVASLLVLAALPIVGDAQAPSPGQPTFRAGTAIVEVSAIVTRDGHPVTDLRADEITVLDNGRPQPIVAFERVDLGRGDLPEQRRDFVLVIDDLHIGAARTQPTIEAALAFVDALGPHDRLTMARTAPPHDLLALSTDRAAARAFIARTRGQQAMAIGPDLEERSRLAIEVLKQVAAGLRGAAAERRAVLLLSEGHPSFPLEFRAHGALGANAIRSEFVGLLRESVRANLAIYPVDPRGLRAPSGAHVPSRQLVASIPGTGSGTQALPIPDAGPMLAGELAGSLAAMAANTGGLQTYWGNDLTRHYGRLFEDSRQYYRIAYAQPEPPPGKRQPRERTIQVKVARPETDVRARQRYAPFVKESS